LEVQAKLAKGKESCVPRHFTEAYTMLDTVTVDTFAPHVGQIFYLQISDTERMAVTLLAAEALGEKRVVAGSKRAPFSLLFRVPPGRVPGQRVYRMENEKLGALEIFLVPITPDAEGPRLEAIFS
jgi:hypothetical protein